MVFSYRVSPWADDASALSFTSRGHKTVLESSHTDHERISLGYFGENALVWLKTALSFFFIIHRIFLTLMGVCDRKQKTKLVF
jgi:hypothetical protein